MSVTVKKADTIKIQLTPRYVVGEKMAEALLKRTETQWEWLVGQLELPQQGSF